MIHLEHSLERTVVVRARRATVWRLLSASEGFARWWGAGSSIDARPGGAVHIRYPNGVVARGEVLEVEPEKRIAFTFGYESGSPIPPGASRVTILLADDPRGTRVELRHAFAEAAPRDQHVPGWRYQLGVFAHLAAQVEHAGLAAQADRWFAAWAEADGAARRAALAECAVDDVELRDSMACLRGRDELDQWIAAAQQHMPGLAMRRSGEPRQCQGSAIVEWQAAAPDGSVQVRGTNLLELAPDGRIARVVGLWAPPGG